MAASSLRTMLRRESSGPTLVPISTLRLWSSFFWNASTSVSVSGSGVTVLVSMKRNDGSQETLRLPSFSVTSTVRSSGARYLASVEVST